MNHQHMPKIFHDPHKNPPVPPPIYLMYSPLENIQFSAPHKNSVKANKKQFITSVKFNLIFRRKVTMDCNGPETGCDKFKELG